ncbi:MAG: hypothetical protein HN730_06185 [Bdellovibrionales bacterium]|nr:hypothetical protein [Bdellovibrionales bacterium]
MLNHLKHYLTIVTLLLLFSSRSTHATVGFGTLVPAVGQYQNDIDGGTTQVAINPYFAWNYLTQLSGNHYLLPEIGFAVHTGTEEEYTKISYLLNVNLGWRFSPSGYLKYGLGTFIATISGEGETISLANGTETANFYAPQEPAYSYQGALNIGLLQFLRPHWALQVDLFAVRFLDSTKRSYSYLISVNFYH